MNADSYEGPRRSDLMSAALAPQDSTFGLVERYDRRWEALLGQTSWDFEDTNRLMIVVQAIGGPLPAWVTPRDALPEWPVDAPWFVIEVVIVHELASLARRLDEVEASRRCYPSWRGEPWRAVFMPEVPSASTRQAIEALGADMVIVTTSGELDIVASTYAGIYTQPQWIPICPVDVEMVARADTRGFGRALVVDGIVDGANAPAVARWLDTVRGEGGDHGAALIVQVVGEREYSDRWSGMPGLAIFGDFVTELRASPDFNGMFGIAVGGPNTVLVVIAFF